MANLNLKEKDIYLRPLSLNDVNSNYLSWLQDPEVMSGIATKDYTLAKLNEYVSNRLNDYNVHFFAIICNVSNIHIGNIKLDFYDNDANTIELGLLIGNKNYWGKGIGKQVCKLILEYAFNVLNIRKIYLAVYENNPGAKRLYEKLGFKIEGCLRKHIAVNGEYFDKYYMGIFKEEAI